MSSPREAIRLDVLVHSGDEDFVRRLRHACRRGGHRLTHVEAIRDLARARVPRATAIFLIDAGAEPAQSAGIAATVGLAHGGLPVALASDRRKTRTVEGIRVVDKAWDTERLIDELELAWIGIPGSIADAPDEWFARSSRSD